MLSEPGALSRLSHDVLDAADAHTVFLVALAGRTDEEEVGGLLLAEVGNELATQAIVVGQRTGVPALGFTDDEGSVDTIEVVNADGGHFAGA